MLDEFYQKEAKPVPPYYRWSGVLGGLFGAAVTLAFLYFG